MSLIHPKSSECVKSELDLFTAPMTQLSIEQSGYVEIHPLAPLTEQSAIEFFIPGDGDRYLDLNNTLIYLEVSIVKGDGTDLIAADNVGLINYPINTIFSQCDVILGDRLISQSSSTHPYRAIIEMLLNYSPGTLKNQGTASLFYKDRAGHMNDIDMASDDANDRYQKRARFTAGSRPFNYSDLFIRIYFSVRGCC